MYAVPVAACTSCRLKQLLLQAAATTVILVLVPQNSHATCPNCQKKFGHMSAQMSGSMPQLWSVCRPQISICIHFRNFSLLWTQISIFCHFGHFDFGHKSTQKPWPMPQSWYFTLATSPHICGTSTKMTVGMLVGMLVGIVV